MSRRLILLLTLPLLVLSSVTLPAPQLFKRTLQKWGVTPSSQQDRSERWKRLLQAQDAVERSSSEVFLESLNPFSIMNDKEYSEMRDRFFKNTSRLVARNEAKEAPSNRRKKRDLAETNRLWMMTHRTVTVKDQLGCNSCWSFLATATLEAVYKYYTGEEVDFSEQYFVECGKEGEDGCSGGTANEGFEVTKSRQYLMSSEDLPYTGCYVECPYWDQIASGEDNAMKKMWLQDWFRASHDEAGMLAALEYSPVAYVAYSSDLLLAYSGGLFIDTDCVLNPTAHAMTLEGYTKRFYYVRGSYGPLWGERGYVRYRRGAAELEDCAFYENAYFITVDYRREMEYAFCNDVKMGTRDTCRASCLAMNTATESGWDLAVIPTSNHNEIVRAMADDRFPGVKSKDKYNFFWIGLLYDDTTRYSWIDGFTATGYLNFTEWDHSDSWGMINKNDGSWFLRSSSTYKARGFCSRPVTCIDISTSIANGGVTFDREELTEGTTATADCDDGYNLSGEETMTCVGGVWNGDLPECVQDGFTATKV